MIELKNINKSYGEFEVLKNLNLSVEESKSIGLQGPSGVGKTTLLRVIAGLETVDEGEVWIDGKLATTREILLHPSDRSLSFVFQFPTLWPHMNVLKNICYGLGKKPTEESLKYTEDLMKNLNIHHLKFKKPHELSGGEAKRVSIARSLVTRKKYVLMDEPLAHLDKGIKVEIVDVIKNYILENDSTLIYVTHDEKIMELLDFSLVLMESNLISKEG